VGLRVTTPRAERAIDMFIPITEAVREGTGLGPGDPYRVIPNLVRPLPEPPAGGDPRLACLPDEPFMLFFGDATVDKGARHLANVYRTLEDPPPLVFVGRCFVDELAFLPGVVLAGPLPHELAIEVVRRSMFTVVPSQWAEPFGLVALETAAAGRPIVASNIGGLKTIVSHEETGLLVEPRDPRALATALSRLIADARLREQMGLAAAERARRFSADIVVPQFEDAYQQVTAGVSAA
jgi:glycosyltransferase involved in cell wall biosynthesis